MVVSLLENIQILCKKQGISVPKLEKEIGLGNGAIYKWGVSSPTVDKLQKVSDYFGVSTDFLITGFDRKIIDTIKSLAKNDKNQPYFPTNVIDALTIELENFKKEYYDVPFDIDPLDMIVLIKETPLSPEFKEDFLSALNRVKQSLNALNALSSKEELDIARDLEKILSNLESDEALTFLGEPLDEETKALMKISLENSMRLAKQIAITKFNSKKYR